MPVPAVFYYKGFPLCSLFMAPNLEGVACAILLCGKMMLSC